MQGISRWPVGTAAIEEDGSWKSSPGMPMDATAWGQADILLKLPRLIGPPEKQKADPEAVPVACPTGESGPVLVSV